MSGTACVPRVDRFRFRMASLAGALILGVLSSCSANVRAATPAAAKHAALGELNLDAVDSSSWEAQLAHSQRISPISSWDGSLDGMKTLWFARGAKKGEGRFVQGRKEDSWTFWYENGRKRWEGTYSHDLVQGPERSWYENGTLCYEGSSVEGKRHGEFKAWYEDGQPWWKGSYELGVREGTFRYWHRDGTPDKKVSGTYISGKRVKPLDQDGLAAAQ